MYADNEYCLPDEAASEVQGKSSDINYGYGNQ